VFDETIYRYFREYLLCGRTPEAITQSLQSGDMGKVLSIQRDIWESLKGDCGKRLNSKGGEAVDQTE